MKIVLTTLNAKYIHSSLALRSIKAYCTDYAEYMDIVEFTINNEENYILSELYKKKPDILCFSCYIWNMEQMLSIIKTIKKVLPNVIIIAGGPEVSYDKTEVMADVPQIDMISYGEGEETFLELMRYFIDGKGTLADIKGLVYRQGCDIVITPARKGLNMDTIPFVYTEDNIKEFENKIIYYETSRGCPYNCQYCLSSIEKGVRFLSLDRVYSDLDFFLSHNIPQVKLVDRTFNCNKKHAMAIWKYLKEHDNATTNFHFEITADLVEDETIEFLKDVRVGLFQFEIGVQSTNDKTIEYIKRDVNFERLSSIVRKIKNGKNIHQHLDLIAGLPGEGYQSFSKSFNDVYALEPEQFQLGFLKLLKGSGLKEDADRYGLVYKDKAPYEVLYTKDLSYDELLKLKMIEEMVETYYNSGKALYSIKYMISFFKTPFHFYEALAQYWQTHKHNAVQHSKMELYTILMLFGKTYICEPLETIKQFLKFDMFLNDNLKSLPNWLTKDKNSEIENKIKNFYKNKENIDKYLPELIGYDYKQASRMSHMEPFDIGIINWLSTGTLEIKETLVLFNYHRKSYILGHASCQSINALEEVQHEIKS